MARVLPTTAPLPLPLLQTPPVHAELSGTHHQILALEGTNPGTMTLPGFLLLSLHFCPSSSALRIQLEGEGADSGEEQRAGGGSACCSILDPAGVGGDHSMFGGRYPFLRSTSTAAGPGEGLRNVFLSTVLF